MMKQLLFIIILFCITNINNAQPIPLSVGVNTTFPMNFKDNIYGINSSELQLSIFDIINKKRQLEIGVNLKYTLLNKVRESHKKVNLFSPQLNLEYNALEIGHSTGIKLNGRIGYGFSNLNKNYIHLGYGIMIDRMIFNHTQLILVFTQNNLINSKLNFFELGFGIRRLLY